MKKAVLFVLVLFSTTIIATFVYAQSIDITNVGANPASGRQMFGYTFKFHQGWNLMPPIWWSKGVCEGHLKYAFLWMPNKGYVGGALDEHNTFNLANFDTDTKNYIQQAFAGVSDASMYISTAGAWVYSDADCEMSGVQMEMRTRNDTSQSAQDVVDARWSKIKLQAGWNIGIVFPDMFYGDSLSSYFKNCQIEKIATWDPDAQKWDFPPQNQLTDNMLITSPSSIDMQDAYGPDDIRANWYWKTFIIKVTNECTLSYSGA